MLHSFTQNQIEPIVADQPKQITSVLKVEKVIGKLVRIDVVLDLEHSDRRDLVIKLVHPDGTEFTIQRRKQNHLRNVRHSFSDAIVKMLDPNVEWKLVVQDLRRGDGGQLNWWRLELELVGSGYNIDVRFQGGITNTQQRVFTTAAERWSEVIVGDLPEAQVGSEKIDDVLIYAEGRKIDGPGHVLGQAGPTHLRSSTLLPIAGAMSFDSDDLAQMESERILLPVILHEMGHVLGIGTIWSVKGFITGSGTDDPRFVGNAAKTEWMRMVHLHRDNPDAGVPLANTGGPGTRESHWRESVFNDELMTGYLDSGLNPMSRLTIASLKDLGYDVDLNAADAFVMKQLAMAAGYIHRQCRTARFNPVVVEGT